MATPDDVLFSYMLSPLFESPDAENWTILKDLHSQVGDWVQEVLASKNIADTIASAMPLEGDKPLQKVTAIVNDCAAVLHLTRPTIYIRNSQEQRAYSFSTSNETFLVLTSGLFELYDNKPEELRFVIGRELGHLKADHGQMRRAGFAVLSLIRTVDASAVPDKFQNALPTLALGRFLSWLRESEITADRAGLLCCQDPEVAYQAMLRQLHGLPERNMFLTQDDAEFDEDKVIRNFQQWQSQPLVKFIVYAKRYSADAPFIPDRLAALNAWVNSGRYEEILNRAAPEGRPKLLTLETIVLKNLASAGTEIRPYVIAREETGTQLLKTTVGPANSDVNWQNINVTTGTAAGKPVFFEVWESRRGFDRMIGGFYIQAVPEASLYNVRIAKDWNDRVTDTSPSFAKVKVRIEERADAEK